MPTHKPRRRRPAHRAVAAPAAAVVLALAAASPAAAATTAASTQTITGAPAPTLVAGFPATTLALGTMTPGATATTSEQAFNIKSNSSWGLKISADRTNMCRWNGSSCVSGQDLASPLEWALTRNGTAIGSPTYAPIVASPSTASAVTLVGPTSDSGTDLGITFKQPVSYADNAGIGGDTYRIVVSYDAAQGF
jgi:hypothetical protein